MSKPSTNFARAPSPSKPQTSDTPALTSSGTLAWNVRDVLFGSNRAIPDPRTDRRTSRQKPE